MRWACFFNLDFITISKSTYSTTPTYNGVLHVIIIEMVPIVVLIGVVVFHHYVHTKGDVFFISKHRLMQIVFFMGRITQYAHTNTHMYTHTITHTRTHINNSTFRGLARLYFLPFVVNLSHGLSCGSPASARLFSAEFSESIVLIEPTIQCWSVPHIALLVPGAFSFVLFSVVLPFKIWRYTKQIVVYHRKRMCVWTSVQWKTQENKTPGLMNGHVYRDS